jgi:protein O-mannosyl-transferase
MSKKTAMFIPLKRFSSLLPLIQAIASLAVFSPALRHSFLINWDDSQYVVGNSIVHGLTLENIKGAFTTDFVGNYAPIHMISYMVDYEIWGLRASGFIFINILLHAANGILFYLLLRRLFGEKVWVSLASLIFLLHPVQVESVVWVSQRKNLLAMFFFLIGFHLYALHKQGEEKPELGFYWLSLVAFTFSLLSKSVAVVFPLVLLLFDRCYRKERYIGALVLDKIPFILLAVVFGLVAIQSHSAQVQGGGTSYHGGSPYATFLTMLPVLIRYLTMILWPANLSAFYDPPIKTHIDSEVAWAAFVLALLCLIGVMLFRRKRQMFFWFALFFIFLIPVFQIIPIVTLMNDRYLYFPMLGAAAFLSVAAIRDVTWSELLHSKQYLSVSIFCILVIGACSAATLHRIPVWQNSYTLWGDAVKKVPNVPLVHDCFGEGLLEQGQLGEALKEFKKALSLQPNVPTETLDTGVRNAKANTHNNIGAAYGRKGMTDEAIEHFAIAVQLNPEFDRAYFNLGNALMHQGLTDQALRCFEKAVRLNPHNPVFNANLRMTRQIIYSRDIQKSADRSN